MSPFKSFIGNMMTSGTGASGAGDIFRQMFLAMMQGKSPQEFMKKWLKTKLKLSLCKNYLRNKLLSYSEKMLTNYLLKMWIWSKNFDAK